MCASSSSLPLHVLKQMGQGSARSSAALVFSSGTTAAASSAAESSVACVTSSFSPAAPVDGRAGRAHLLGGWLLAVLVLLALAPLDRRTAALGGRRRADGQEAAGGVLLVNLHVSAHGGGHTRASYVGRELLCQAVISLNAQPWKSNDGIKKRKNNQILNPFRYFLLMLSTTWFSPYIVEEFKIEIK